MAGGGGIFALATADYLSRVPRSAISTASGIGAAAQSMTYIVFGPILGELIEVSGGYTTPYLALGVWLIPGCVTWLLWKPPPLVQDEPPSPAQA